MPKRTKLSLINFYKNLLKSGSVSPDGGAYNRLDQLKRMYYDQSSKKQTK